MTDRKCFFEINRIHWISRFELCEKSKYCNKTWNLELDSLMFECIYLMEAKIKPKLNSKLGFSIY